MDKLLILCGPTATGKTALALSLAQRFSGELVSADSRQIYIGMDIGTGKDIPVNSRFSIRNSQFKLKNDYYQYGFYDIGAVPVWMLDVARPDQEFSVAHYHELAIRTIKAIQSRGRLPIVVGGTGLYIKSLIEQIPTMSVPQDNTLRDSLSSKTTPELQLLLQEKDPTKFDSMNNSDRHNPRRLVRAIEVASYEGSVTIDEKSFNTAKIGLTVPNEELQKRIKHRVEKRISQGIIEEVQRLLKKGYSWNLPSMQTLGYSQWQLYIEGKKTLEEVVEEWTRDEIQYAKRQMTWFKKQSAISWYDSTHSSVKPKIEQAVETWYTK